MPSYILLKYIYLQIYFIIIPNFNIFNLIFKIIKSDFK